MEQQANPFIVAATPYKEIPLLTARDVELRVGSLDKDGKWVTFLAYKDARVDMRILDEVYGPTNWKREHAVIDGQLFCTVSIWDNAKGMWISKQDVGKESKTEAEKGRASDSFKRACFNVGIGRELYDAPFIYIKLNPSETGKNAKGMIFLKTKFSVKKMTYNKNLGEFSEFVVADQHGKIRFTLGQEEEEQADDTNNKPKGVQTAEQAFGAAAGPVGYTKLENGIWFVKSKNNGVWADPRRVSLERLNDMLNDQDYAPAHQAIFEIMSAKGANNG